MKRYSLYDLLTQIRSLRGNPQPGFSLFLGAGASKSSGIPLASELAEEAFKRRFLDEGNRITAQEQADETSRRVEGWLRLQRWYSEEKSRYQLAMENVLLSPGARATFLREYLAKARFSRGYRRLAQLLEARIFDTVYTTNFDELVRKGSENILNTPLVEVASTEQYIQQATSPCDPRLIRLHGDYWHRNLLNTEGELEAAPEVRFNAINRLCRPQGMIVMGYGGQDRKVMVELFHRGIEDRHFLENGLFWCLRPNSKVPDHLRVLAEKDKFGERIRIVEIDGFDEAMEVIASAFGLDADKWVLTDSLRSAYEWQALATSCCQLLYDGEDHRPIVARVNEVFRRLCSLLAAKEAILVVAGHGKSDLIGTVNVSEDLDLTEVENRLPPITRSSPVRISNSDPSVGNLFGDPSERRELVIYPVFKKSLRIGMVILSFDPRSGAIEQEEHVTQALCALIVLAARN